ncbi:MAG TPA: hypothetical protein PKV71_16600 [Calditrichia bacterium]|nr:hypothetical protein [Calditrichota bacterium]HQU73081.1 hypothetical protein [Calditrichia bacterium]HQV33508.1 hypothetical protein [Calditrichia bacterium]
MQKITAEAVEKGFETIAELSPADTEKLMGAFQSEQNDTFDYLLSVGEDILEEEERETLVLTGMVLWKIMSDHGPLPKPDAETLDKQEGRQFKLVEALNEGVPGLMSISAEKLLDNYPQEHLLALIEDLVLYPDEEDPDDLQDENRPWLFVFLKTLIDCWDA